MMDAYLPPSVLSAFAIILAPLPVQSQARVRLLLVYVRMSAPVVGDL
jgi:hypothetical protein